MICPPKAGKGWLRLTPQAGRAVLTILCHISVAVGLVDLFQSLNIHPGLIFSGPWLLPVCLLKLARCVSRPCLSLSLNVAGREKWQGRFLQSHTPAHPYSQSGLLPLLPRGGVADLAWHLLQPREPLLATVTSSLCWSEHFLQGGVRMGSHSIGAFGGP